MVLEHALLSLRPGAEGDFESAFTDTKTIIASMPGFEDLTLPGAWSRRAPTS